MKTKTATWLYAINVIVIAAIFGLNYVYQKNDFDFTLKCICSGGFAVLGLLNVGYALAVGCPNRRFFMGMASGLVLCMLGDVLIGFDFIVGAATFAIGHVCFAVSCAFLRRWKGIDWLLGGVLFAGAAIFLLTCPLLRFDVPVFQAVCVVYALIISAMLGKALGNMLQRRCVTTVIIGAASVLFFVSDLMLVLDWFIGRWDWTSEACMGTYYPALCLLAFSMVTYLTEQCSQ